MLSNARGDVDEAKRASPCADHPPNYPWLIAALMREFSEVMLPFTTGNDYVNQIGLETDEGSERIKAAYGANCERLVAVKNKYDPTNLFRHTEH